jgi:hypothetical protein
MINMNINETKKLKFGVAVSGVQTRDLAGTMRILIDGVEYGFPTSVLDDKILVEIPPLSDVVKIGLREGRTLKAKLDIVVGDTAITPWADTIKLIMPITVEAVISEEESIKKTETVKLNLEDDISKKVKKSKDRKLKENEQPKRKTRMSKIFEEKK